MENVPILYINLDRSKERKVRMEEQFKQFGITNYKRVPAFDGRKLFFRLQFESQNGRTAQGHEAVVGRDRLFFKSFKGGGDGAGHRRAVRARDGGRHSPDVL
jgi:hypothetical protein